ncbi:hypothetical protein predicted by Glimmer/Critica [Sorangium cellulosum So ce56]|uniref:Secreted protein n=1 Tax=Sorangium cellulosum (strain So ce56) TaxID=448385 RepID=A9FB21_SORC5|nr:hypothetical protein [Sorangium cellulosum]CAN97968.1 hypothetical protein predicted by Glimmer/Critica [Sorangium cellulosum So ce56]
MTRKIASFQALALGRSLSLLLLLVHCTSTPSPTTSAATPDAPPGRGPGSLAERGPGPDTAPEQGPARGPEPATDGAPASDPAQSPASDHAPRADLPPPTRPARCAAPARPAQDFVDCVALEVFAAGCCYPSFEAACAGLGCALTACELLKSSPPQAGCTR